MHMVFHIQKEVTGNRMAVRYSSILIPVHFHQFGMDHISGIAF